MVITLRADFYDRPLLYEGFGALVRECTEVILPLTRAGTPGGDHQPGGACRAGDRAGTGRDDHRGCQPAAGRAAAAAICADGSLRATQRVSALTLDAYHEIGGITAALARRAEEVYNGLAPDRQDLARQMFLRLIGLDEEIGSDAPPPELVGADLTHRGPRRRLNDIRDTFVKYRLLTTDRDPKTREPTIEVAHEALLREWERLNEWLDASREDIQMQRRLQAVAAEWQKARSRRRLSADRHAPDPVRGVGRVGAAATDA